MVRVTWTRRNVYARHHETGVWETRTECDWLAEPVIDDYRVTLLCGDREVQVTVYAVVGRTEALQAARERFWERFCGGVHLEVAALDIELLTVVPGFLL
jgi:hypothetical protein